MQPRPVPEQELRGGAPRTLNRGFFCFSATSRKKENLSDNRKGRQGTSELREKVLIAPRGTLSFWRGQLAETPVGSGPRPCEARPWIAPTAWSWAGSAAACRFSGKTRQSLTVNVYYITFVAHVLTFKGRDLFDPDGLQLQLEGSFVFPFLYLSYSLVCVQAVDAVSAFLFLHPWLAF